MDATTYPPQSIDPRIVPPPTRLHWGWVLALSILTRGYFNAIWLVVQAYWIKRITGRGESLWWSIAHVCVLPAVFMLAIMIGATVGLVNHGTPHPKTKYLGATLGAIAVIFILIAYVKTVYTMRRDLASAPINIPLGGVMKFLSTDIPVGNVMTFLFSAIYFQYFLRDYVLPDAITVYGPFPPSPAYVPATSPPSQ